MADNNQPEKKEDAGSDPKPPAEPSYLKFQIPVSPTKISPTKLSPRKQKMTSSPTRFPFPSPKRTRHTSGSPKTSVEVATKTTTSPSYNVALANTDIDRIAELTDPTPSLFERNSSTPTRLLTPKRRTPTTSPLIVGDKLKPTSLLMTSSSPARIRLTFQAERKTDDPIESIIRIGQKEPSNQDSKNNGSEENKLDSKSEGSTETIGHEL